MNKESDKNNSDLLSEREMEDVDGLIEITANYLYAIKEATSSRGHGRIRKVRSRREIDKDEEAEDERLL